MSNFKRVLQPLFLIAAFLVVAQVGSAVSAMCVYNQADVEVYVEFDCGIFCENDWNTEPNNVYCRAGEAGLLSTGFGPEALDGRVGLNVDAHGYVVMTQPSIIEVEVCAYREDDSLVGCQSSNPTS